MNKKTIGKMILLMIIGGIVGGAFTLGLVKLTDRNTISLIGEIGDFFVDNSIAIYIVLAVVLFLPALYHFQKGKAVLISVEEATEEDYDELEKKGSRIFDNVITINSVFMVLNFMLIGMTFTRNKEQATIILALFLINILASSILEITTIKFIQKMDKRLKGDPTSLKFSKDFLGSLDEAEQLKVYKVGYLSFRFSRMMTLALIVLSILFNFVFETGGLSIFLIGIMMISQAVSYNVYAIKNQ
jgi:hypothetical protein